jgi:hypothetical protein
MVTRWISVHDQATNAKHARLAPSAGWRQRSEALARYSA